jgi:hypothetical protein
MGEKIEMYPEKKFEKELIAKAKKHLLGRTITDIRFMSETERDNNAWDKRGIVITLDDGNILYPMTDEEGNDAGAIGTSYKQLNILGRI